MKSLLWITVAVLCNAGAQIALKAGATTNPSLKSFISPWLVAGVVLYGISFVVTVRIYADHPLSVISPLMAGAIFVLICLASAVFFDEPLSPYKVAGITLIIAGIALLTRAA